MKRLLNSIVCIIHLSLAIKSKRGVLRSLFLWSKLFYLFTKTELSFPIKDSTEMCNNSLNYTTLFIINYLLDFPSSLFNRKVLKIRHKLLKSFTGVSVPFKRRKTFNLNSRQLIWKIFSNYANLMSILKYFKARHRQRIFKKGKIKIMTHISSLYEISNSLINYCW